MKVRYIFKSRFEICSTETTTGEHFAQCVADMLNIFGDEIVDIRFE